MKTILKWFLPNSKKLSNTITEKIADAINSSDKAETISKYAQMSTTALDISSKISQWLQDGKIDETEKKEIAEKLQPLIQSLIDMI